MPSTIAAGMPKPRARSAMSGVAWLFDVGTEIAIPLFSQMKTSGTCQSIAMFSVSKNSPSHEAPSPKKQSTTCPVPRKRQDSAAPPAIGMWPATIAFVEIRPTDGSERCIEPPLPLQTPVARPISSAIIATGSTPLSSASPCPR